MTKSITVRSSRSDFIFDICNYAVLIIIFLIVAYPLYFVVIASFSNPAYVRTGEVVFLPQGFTLEGYINVFKDKTVITGYINSIVYTVLGVCINLVFTIPAAYALSRKDLAGRKVFMLLIIFTMFFSGGMIPLFILIRDLNMYNSMWSLIIPVAITPWNLIVAKTFFEQSIPDSLREATAIDGCDDFHFFFRFVLPLSSALIAIMILFYGVAHWNSYFNALLFIRDQDRFPLQLVLRNILLLNQVSQDQLGDVVQAARRQEAALLIQYTMIIISAFPLLVLYPFLQKYFVRGVMIGAVKG